LRSFASHSQQQQQKNSSILRPFWLSPRQAMVCPLNSKVLGYAKEIQQKLESAGYYVDCESPMKTLQKQIRDAQLAQYNFILVVGEKEVNEGTISVRTRDNVIHGTQTLSSLLNQFEELVRAYK
jgi:threonyl-tRNA synthetase